MTVKCEKAKPDRKSVFHEAVLIRLRHLPSHLLRKLDLVQLHTGYEVIGLLWLRSEIKRQINNSYIKITRRLLVDAHCTVVLVCRPWRDENFTQTGFGGCATANCIPEVTENRNFINERINGSKWRPKHNKGWLYRFNCHWIEGLQIKSRVKSKGFGPSLQEIMKNCTLFKEILTDYITHGGGSKT